MKLYKSDTEYQPVWNQEATLEDLKEALAEYRFVAVPAEPTIDMLDDAVDILRNPDESFTACAYDIYLAMTAAAQD